MSTKSTIQYSRAKNPDEDFEYHLYSEAFEDDCVYLEMRNVEFSCSNNYATVKIPNEIAKELGIKTR